MQVDKENYYSKQMENVNTPKKWWEFINKNVHAKKNNVNKTNKINFLRNSNNELNLEYTQKKEMCIK